MLCFDIRSSTTANIEYWTVDLLWPPESSLWFRVSMTSLLTHTVAHSTRPSFRPKTNNQTIKKYLSLAVSWVKVVKNCTSFQKIKWFKNWSFQKMSITKSVPLKSYSSMKIFFRKIWIIFDIENWLWKSEFCHFWQLLLNWPQDLKTFYGAGY